MDVSEAFGYGVVGTVFALYGLSMMIRQKGHIGIGRPAIQTFEVTGLLAKIIGGSVFIAGILFGSRFIFALMSLSSSLTERLPLIGMLIVLAGVIFGTILQIAISLGETIHSRHHEATRHNE